MPQPDEKHASLAVAGMDWQQKESKMIGDGKIALHEDTDVLLAATGFLAEGKDLE